MRIAEEVRNQLPWDKVTKAAEDELEIMAQTDEIQMSAQELMRQSSVLIWGAFEVLATDVIAALLNSKPKLSTSLARHPKIKKMFEPRVTIDLIEEYGFNISAHMGDIFTASVKTDGLPIIRDIFSVLAPGHGDLRNALDTDDLWKLNQRRHLIVHRRSIIDAAYLKRTGDDVPIGSPLVIFSEDLEKYLALVKDAGTLLTQAAADIMNDDQTAAGPEPVACG